MKQDFQDQFLDELLQKAGFEMEDDTELLKADLRPLIQERINLHIYQELDEEQQKKLTQLLDANKLKEAEDYVRGIITDYDDFLMEIYAQFEDEYLEHIKGK